MSILTSSPVTKAVVGLLATGKVRPLVSFSNLLHLILFGPV